MAVLRVAIFGAGSVGCFIGGAWASAGIPVTFVGRESIRSAIAQNGLTLTDFSGWRLRLPPDQVDFATKPSAIAKADVILLCVKSQATASVAKDLSRNAKKGAVIVTFQNGVSNAETLRTLLKNRFEVIQGSVPFNIAYLGHGRFHKGVAGDLVAADHPVTRALAESLEKTPGKLRLSDDMPAIAWGKLLINLNNAINALSGLTLLEEFRQRDFRRVLAAAMIEALELLKAAGIEPANYGPVPARLLPHVFGAPDLVFNNLFLRIQKVDAKARSSMFDDLEAGRATEVDYLNGEVVKLAARLGRKAPVNSKIVALIRQREAGVEHLWTPEDLRRHVLEGHSSTPLFGY